MGRLCDKMKQTSRGVWRTFFPKEVEIPDCVYKLLEFIYPTVDWDKVTFHEGWPHLIGLGAKDAMTLPDTYTPHRIRIYLKPGEWSVCNCHDLGLFFVHEGFHVLQNQDMLGGWGLGLVRANTILYLACWAANGFKYDGHSLEVPAYKVAGCVNSDHCESNYGIRTSLFEACCNRDPKKSLPCNCKDDPPSFQAAALENFKKNCAHIVQQSSGINFWKHLAECTPGLKALAKAARDLYEKACKSDVDKSPDFSSPGSPGPGPGPTDPENPPPEEPEEPDGQGRGISIPLKWLTCLFGLIGAGFLYLLYGFYFAAWLIFWSGIAIGAWLLKIFVELVGLLTTGILFGVTGMVCAVEWLWEWFKKNVLDKACNWATNVEKKCTSWEKTTKKKCKEYKNKGDAKCTKQEDEGYEKCTNWKDEGYSKCCDWVPCKWACKALVWVSNWVCKGSIWVWHKVCVASVWVWHKVCVAWIWVSHKVCVAWVSIVSTTCKTFTWGVKKTTCW